MKYLRDITGEIVRDHLGNPVLTDEYMEALEEYYTCRECEGGLLIPDRTFSYDMYPPLYDHNCDSCGTWKRMHDFGDLDDGY